MTDKSVTMQIGMMWYGKHKNKDIVDPYEMIANAAGYYYSKFGVVPERVHINPSMFENGTKILEQHGQMTLVLDESIRPNYVWIGVVR